MEFSIGDIRVHQVNELDSWPFPSKEMFPGVRRDLYDADILDFRIATYVVRTPTLTMLVDVGNGNGKHRPVLTAHDGFSTDYLTRLAAVVEPDAVDVVVCTHLHPDHCGGLTRFIDGRWAPTFPRAKHLVSHTEFAWLQALYDSGPLNGPAADLARTFDDSVRPVLEAGLVEFVDVPAFVTAGVTVVPAPGHTAGHVVVELVSGEQYAVISGDVLHHPFQLADLHLPHAGDADPQQAHTTRRELAERLAANGGLLLPAHFAAGYIRNAATGLHYERAR